MLKKFFLTFLGSMAAIWISVLMFIVLTITFVAGIVGASMQSSDIREHSILHLCLSGSINERNSSQNIQDIVLNGAETSSSFEEILDALRFAADDERIDGVYIECDGSDLGYASRAELRKAINRFKESSGKWVLAYGDSYSQGDYYVATTADTIYLNPVGNLDIHGIASSVPYFKEALDKLDVDIQVFKVGTYKSAVEPFMLNSMSEPARMQTQLFIDSIWKNIAGEIGGARKISTKAVYELADSLTMSKTAEYCRQRKLTDKTAYRRQVEEVLRNLTGIEDDEDLRLVSPREYVNNADLLNTYAELDRHIAVLFAEGDITDDGNEGISAASIVPEILQLAKDENVAGMVLRVNSGGGSAFASEQIWDAIRRFKAEGKPVYVSMGDYAASGGYYISCGADRIYAMPQTLTGSIGIFGIIPSIQGTLNNHLGIHLSTVKTGDNAETISITSPMNDYQKGEMQRYIEHGYDTFVSRVAGGRHLSTDSVKAIAQGRVWDGTTALHIGLIDRIGSLYDAITDLARQLDMSPTAYVAYPELHLSPIDRLIASTVSNDMSMNERIFWKDIAPKDLNKTLKILQQITTLYPVQARMEDITLR